MKVIIGLIISVSALNSLACLHRNRVVVSRENKKLNCTEFYRVKANIVEAKVDSEGKALESTSYYEVAQQLRSDEKPLTYFDEKTKMNLQLPSEQPLFASDLKIDFKNETISVTIHRNLRMMQGRDNPSLFDGQRFSLNFKQVSSEKLELFLSLVNDATMKGRFKSFCLDLQSHEIIDFETFPKESTCN